MLLVWALPGPGLLLPLYLATKATASSLTNNQCFMFYTQQMSDHRIVTMKTALTLASGDQRDEDQD